jgi:hypothetical protein
MNPKEPLLVNAAEPINGSTATPAELRRAGIGTLVRALGPVGMARFLQQFDPGRGDYRPDHRPEVTSSLRRCYQKATRRLKPHKRLFLKRC